MTETLDLVSLLGPALAARIGEERYRLWFANKTRFHVEDSLLIIGVANRFCQEWLQNKFWEEVSVTGREVLGRPIGVKFVIDPELFQASRRQQVEVAATPPPVKQRVTKKASGPPNPAESISHSKKTVYGAPSRRWRSLADFQVGSCNRLAYAAILNLLEAPEAAGNPTTVYGSTGVGKTHLLEGLFTQWRQILGDAVVYVTAEDFTNRFLQAMHSRQMAGFRREFRHAAALVFDDFHFLANKQATQEEFLHTFEVLDRRNRPVVLASACHPKMLADLMPELADRLLGGGIWPIDVLDRDTRLAVLRQKSVHLHCPIPDEAITYLADQLRGNVREIEGALHTIRHFAQVHRQPLSLSLVREATSQLVRFNLRIVQIKDVEKTICQLLDVEARALRSASRARTHSYPRMVAMYLARHHAGASFTEIGRYFGNRNHSTAFAAERKVRQWKDADITLLLGDRRWRIRELLDKAERELLH